MKLIPRRYQSVSFYAFVAVMCLSTFVGNYFLYGYFLNQDQLAVSVLFEQASTLTVADLEREILASDFVLLSASTGLESAQIGDIHYTNGLGFLVAPVWLSKSYYFILVNAVCIGLFFMLVLYIKKQQQRLKKSVQLIKRSAKPVKFERLFSSNQVDDFSKPAFEPLLNTTLLGLGDVNYKAFLIIECRQGKTLTESQTKAMCLQIKQAIKIQFDGMHLVSMKCLPSGRMTLTLAKISSVLLNNIEKKLHGLISHIASGYNKELVGADVKLGLCNYRTEAHETIDQTLVYQLAEAALAVSRTNSWQHYYRLTYNHTHNHLLTLSAKQVMEVIDKKQYLFLFQPVFSIADGDILQHEALLRLRHKELGLLCAKQFLANVVSLDDQRTLDLKVLTNVLKIIENEPGYNRVSININHATLLDVTHLSQLLNMLNTQRIEHRVAFEISLQDLSGQSIELLKTIQLLAQAKVAIVLDNIEFEFKYKTQLTQLNVIGLKLDLSLVHQIEHHVLKQHSVRKIIALAIRQNIPVYATGVESKAELDVLTKLGVTGAQGHYFSEPLQQLALFSQV